MINSFIANDRDDVVTVLEPVVQGSPVTYIGTDGECKVTALDDIPKFHKVAIRDVPKDDLLYKYGEVIGLVTKDIHAGDHVHTHNLTDVPREEAAK